jgi:hypothetical protein
LAGATPEQVQETYRRELATVQNMIPDQNELTSITQGATGEVDELLRTDASIRRFHGKTVLKTFFNRNLSSTGVGYSETCLRIAKNVSKNTALLRELDTIFDSLAT